MEPHLNPPYYSAYSYLHLPQPTLLVLHSTMVSTVRRPIFALLPLPSIILDWPSNSVTRGSEKLKVSAILNVKNPNCLRKLENLFSTTCNKNACFCLICPFIWLSLLSLLLSVCMCVFLVPYLSVLLNCLSVRLSFCLFIGSLRTKLSPRFGIVFHPGWYGWSFFWTLVLPTIYFQWQGVGNMIYKFLLRQGHREGIAYNRHLSKYLKKSIMNESTVHRGNQCMYHIVSLLCNIYKNC